VAAWFLWTGKDLLIFSKPNQQKTRNLRQNPHVILALDNTNLGVDPITLEGEAELLDDPDVNTTLPDYLHSTGCTLRASATPPRRWQKPIARLSASRPQGFKTPQRGNHLAYTY
jgi:hypothetical protein